MVLNATEIKIIIGVKTELNWLTKIKKISAQAIINARIRNALDSP